MNPIKISNEERGEIRITPVNKLSKKKKHTLKCLSFLQLLCMSSSEEEDELFPQVLDILVDTTDKIANLYRGYEDEASSTEQF